MVEASSKRLYSWSVSIVYLVSFPDPLPSAILFCRQNKMADGSGSGPGNTSLEINAHWSRETPPCKEEKWLESESVI